VNAALILSLAEIFSNDVADKMRRRSIPRTGFRIFPGCVPIHDNFSSTAY
jgi:hypothetical protein